MTEPDSDSLTGPEPAGGATYPRCPGRAARIKGRSRAFRWVIEVVVIVAAAFVLALLVQHFIVKPFAIPSPSMEPTLVEGDRVLVNRLVYHFHPPRAGRRHRLPPTRAPGFGSVHQDGWWPSRVIPFPSTTACC